MSVVPQPVAAAITQRLGARITGARPLTGGMVCRAAQVSTPCGTLFAKWKESAPPRFFECEADGLRRLRAVGGLRVPDVLAWDDNPGSGLSWLALEWIPDAGRPQRAASVRLGEGLARLHRAPAGGRDYGLEVDNFLGSQPQRNAPTASWPAFYRDQRIAPQVEVARARGLLTRTREALLRAAMDRAEEVLGGAPGPACLVHGDLWAGNVLCAGDEPVLIDPAVYRADREVELAYMELFSGFDSAALEAYRSAYPLDAGYAYRRPMLQLYPLVIHLNHFGETYGPQVEEACLPYAGGHSRGTTHSGGA